MGHRRISFVLVAHAFVVAEVLRRDCPRVIVEGNVRFLFSMSVIVYPFLDPSFSSHCPVEQPCIIKYLKTL